ncbi:nickel transporter [Streptomyces sp. NBC_00829]|uniref:HoxN/HupN/NixA family nickel/cobalt transporter n=1 Tax=Streptomyces sp. NBC_00829 TaxID=2903679 RepID=UPI003865700A|nr:nickel transporter [Streptomyces sp. NBC_00829]
MNRRTTAVGAAVLVAGAALAVLPAGTAAAHPLGNFTVNRYDGLLVAPGRLTVDHVEDLAEIPAAQARTKIDRDGDRKMSPGELSEWAVGRCGDAARASRVTAGQRTVVLASGTSRAEVRPGQAGLPTLRVECRLTAELPDGRQPIGFTAAGEGQGPGWREITAGGDRMTLTSSDVPKASVSRRLTRYPGGELDSAPDTTKAALTVTPGGAPAAADRQEAAPPASVLPRGADRWTRALTDLVAKRDLTAGFAALALGTALLLGALHALAPGHGKTVMAAAAAAGGRNSLRDVLSLGASVTITHTLGVFALGGLIAVGSAAAPSVVAWLGVVSGALVAFAGAVLVRRAWRNRGAGHGHSHGHGHGHSHGHSHSHGDEHTHGHGDDQKPEHGHDHGHTHGHGHTHDHRSLGLRSTILLGFAGGLVPSPSAVVVLVGAAALGRAWFGLLLVLAYGAGLALTLAAAGFAAVRLGERATRLLADRTRRKGPLFSAAQRALPLGTACVVLAIGCGLALRGAATALA